MASPVRLMRRSIRKTPTGQERERQHQRAGERALHEAEFDEGRDQVLVHVRRSRRGRAGRYDHADGRPHGRGGDHGDRRGHAHAPALPARTTAHRRARLRRSGGRAAGSRAAATSAVVPQATGRRASSSVSGKCSRTRWRSCTATMTVRFSPCQRLISATRSTTVLGVDGVERLVEQDDLGVLDQHAGKQRALQLAAGQRVDRACLEALEPDRHQRLRHRSAVFLGEAAEQAAPAATGPSRRDRRRAPGRSGRARIAAADRRCSRRARVERRCRPSASARRRCPSSASICRSRWRRRRRSASRATPCR